MTQGTTLLTALTSADMAMARGLGRVLDGCNALGAVRMAGRQQLAIVAIGGVSLLLLLAIIGRGRPNRCHHLVRSLGRGPGARFARRSQGHHVARPGLGRGLDGAQRGHHLLRRHAELFGARARVGRGQHLANAIGHGLERFH